ncbi:MAG: Crp/Fnr family transcriptional regulator [Opitutaceae bacterium]|nr:Crp/Fnr family transcriptional regulator [Cytophagales bacterium]
MSFLESIALITPLSVKAKDALTAIAKPVTFLKNQTLLEEGSICEYLYYVEKGCLRGFTNQDGNMATYWFAMERMFATSFGSFISRTASRESIMAIEDCDLISIHYPDLEKLYSQFHEFETVGRIISQEYYLRLEDRTYNLQFLSAKERYEQLILSYPSLLQRVPLGYIASYLGISQETLSRIRAKF